MKAKCWNACAVCVILYAATLGARAQMFTSLVSFDDVDGAYPIFGPLTQGNDGNFYGTTALGGTHGYGTVFKVTANGGLTTLYSFCSQTSCADGGEPQAGLVLATDGYFYGTTVYGGGEGGSGRGTVFKITPDGTLTTLHTFDSTDGIQTDGALVQATDGNFYGTTQNGGSGNNCDGGCGTVFKVTSEGTFTTLHNFSLADGGYLTAGLIQAKDGALYGTTAQGGTSLNCGANGCGTIFKITLGGALTTLHSFDSTDGAGPDAGLVQASNGTFYGSTGGGGSSNNCSQGCGTFFKMTPSGTLTSLHSFNYNDGYVPYGTLVLATDGNLYGVTFLGGKNYSGCAGGGIDGCGTIFVVTPGGVLKTLYTFCSLASCGDGGSPTSGLIQSTNGIFYGTTQLGGNGEGTVFSLSMGLDPFVAFVRSSGYVGQTGPILGQGFTGATNVSLNGTSVPFTIKSDTLITATIPAGGTSGPVTVTTPTGTLTSNVPFRVLPQLLSFTPTSGPVGTQVTITGVSFTQTTGVGFGDYTPAQFTVNSDTQVTATVPTGAQTGPVGIQTQGGIAISTQAFTVTQ